MGLSEKPSAVGFTKTLGDSETGGDGAKVKILRRGFVDNGYKSSAESILKFTDVTIASVCRELVHCVAPILAVAAAVADGRTDTPITTDCSEEGDMYWRNFALQHLLPSFSGAVVSVKRTVDVGGLKLHAP